MLDDELSSQPTEQADISTVSDTAVTEVVGRRPRRRVAQRPAGPPEAQTSGAEVAQATSPAGGTASADPAPEVQGSTPKRSRRSKAVAPLPEKSLADRSAAEDASGERSSDQRSAADEAPGERSADERSVAEESSGEVVAPRAKRTRKRAAPNPVVEATATTTIAGTPEASAPVSAAPTETTSVASTPADASPTTGSSASPGSASPGVASAGVASAGSASDGSASAVAAREASTNGASTGVALLFQAPDLEFRAPGRAAQVEPAEAAEPESEQRPSSESTSSRRRRSRGGRSRRKSTSDAPAAGAPGDGSPDDAKTAATLDLDDKQAPANDRARVAAAEDGTASDAGSRQAGDEDGSEVKQTDESGQEEGGTSRRRRRRRRSGEEPADSADDPAQTVVKVRAPRTQPEAISGVEGSTRIEAKRQRRREGREAGRRRPPILSEAEFLARRESVDRVMAIRQRGDVTQIGVLEDNVLVEHYVALESQTSLIGNVYLGRVQNVLPSMEAAFVDIGKGRNAVLYAGEVDWDLVDSASQSRRIENALKPGQAVMVQISKDPVGHKGARLTSQISLPGRYLVYVPGGGASGISRKLPDIERTRLKKLLKDILPDEAGVIVRTAAEGASEDELQRDVARLTARWEDIERKASAGHPPSLLYGEPDTTIKVVRDLFTEDFARLVISGDQAWDMVEGYVGYVAPDLADRLERYDGDDDIFSQFRIDEQIAKALERKVWLPSGGSLVIDRTEAMTVIDVNTGKFTGAGGNLEETVTKNNLEAAEEIVRQLRLRDIGGIIVIDFIDMVLESNRDLVLRRLVECLGRDRTRHQVAEVTSLGLVQMTRKRIGTGLLEAFSHTCELCSGRGVVIETAPVEAKKDQQNGAPHPETSRQSGSASRSSSRRRGRRGGTRESDGEAAADLAVQAGDVLDGEASGAGTVSATAATSDPLTADAG